jgi:hypothetical protein
VGGTEDFDPSPASGDALHGPSAKSKASGAAASSNDEERKQPTGRVIGITKRSWRTRGMSAAVVPRKAALVDVFQPQKVEGLQPQKQTLLARASIGAVLLDAFTMLLALCADDH